MASERERDDARERRREWIERRQPRMRLQPARLVFIDETAVNTKMTRLRGRSRHNKAVNFEGTAGAGELVEVEIAAATSQTLTGQERLVSRAL